jgi:hypothetical protein
MPNKSRSLQHTMSSAGFQEVALQNRAAIGIISPTSTERQPVSVQLLDGRKASIPVHQVAVLSEIPNVIYVNPLTSYPSGAFNGSETFLDFEVPQQVHVLTGLNVRFTLGFDNSGAALAPTPYWCSRIETYAGKDLISTQYPESVYNDSIAWRDIQNRREWADPLNFTADLDSVEPLNLQLPYLNRGDVYPNPNFGSTQNGNANASQDFYLPLTNCLTQARVFCAGFVVPFRIRLYLQPRITLNFAPDPETGIVATTVSTVNGNHVWTPTPGGGWIPSTVVTGVNEPVTANTSVTYPGGGAITLQQIQLVVSEQAMAQVNFEQKMRVHRNGNVLYKVVIADRYQNPFQTLSPGQSQNTQLKAFKSLSAGIVTTLLPQAAFNTPEMAQLRLPIANLQLLDQMGRKLSEVIPDALFRRFIFPKHIASDYGTYQPQYLLPFSSDFGETAKNAVNLGYMQLTTLEQLVITAAPAYEIWSQTQIGNWSNVMLNIHAYNYAAINCTGGVPAVTYT